MQLFVKTLAQLNRYVGIMNLDTDTSRCVGCLCDIRWGHQYRCVLLSTVRFNLVELLRAATDCFISQFK